MEKEQITKALKALAGALCCFAGVIEIAYAILLIFSNEGAKISPDSYPLDSSLKIVLLFAIGVTLLIVGVKMNSK